MNVSPTMQKTNAGTCPHGNPIGACPICNGIGGGGGGSSSKVRNPGEMSYEQCYSVWQQMLKAKAIAAEQKELQHLEQMKAQDSIPSFADKIIDKIGSLTQRMNVLNIQNQTYPTLSTRIQAAFTQVAITALNVVKTVANVIQKTVSFIQQKLADITDKLSAVFGELKLAIEKKFSLKFNFKTKLKSIFNIFNPLDVENEEKQIEEEKFLFKLKTTLSKIQEKFNYKKLKRS